MDADCAIQLHSKRDAAMEQSVDRMPLIAACFFICPNFKIISAYNICFAIVK
jgi:hypothetical protein